MFWGLELKPRESQTLEPERTLHVTQMALGVCDKDDTERNVVQCQVDGKTIVLGSLRQGVVEQISLDLVFACGTKVTFFTSGPGDVHLSGYYVNLTEPEPEDDGVCDCTSESEEDCDCGGECLCHEEALAEAEAEEDEGEDVLDGRAMLKELLSDKSIDDEDDEDDEFVPSADAEEEDEGVSALRRALREEKKKSPKAAAEDEDEEMEAVEEVQKDAEAEKIIARKEDPDEESPEPAEDDADAIIMERAKKQEAEAAKGMKRKVGVRFEDTAQPPQKRSKKQKAQDKPEEAPEKPQEPAEKPQEEQATKAQKKKDKKKKQQEKKQQQAKESEPQPEPEKEKEPEAEAEKPAEEKKTKKSKKDKKKAKEPEAKKAPKEKEPEEDEEDDAPATPTKERPESLKRKDTPRPVKKVAAATESGPVPMKPLRLKNGLVVQDLVMGTGNKPLIGRSIRVRYVGRLTNGKIFDQTKGQPFSFRFGAGDVIKGWDIGISGMRVGGKRRLTIPPSLGYGSGGAGIIPPNSTLNFDVELVDA